MHLASGKTVRVTWGTDISLEKSSLALLGPVPILAQERSMAEHLHCHVLNVLSHGFIPSVFRRELSELWAGCCRVVPVPRHSTAIAPKLNVNEDFKVPCLEAGRSYRQVLIPHPGNDSTSEPTRILEVAAVFKNSLLLQRLRIQTISLALPHWLTPNV